MPQPYGHDHLTDLIALKLSPQLKAQLIAEAERREMSLSAVARLAIRAGLAAQQHPTTATKELTHA